MIVKNEDLSKISSRKRKLLLGSCFAISGTNNSDLTSFIDNDSAIKYRTFTQREIMYLLALFGANISESNPYSSNNSIAYPINKSVTHIVLLDDLSSSVEYIVEYKYPELKCVNLVDLFTFLNDKENTSVDQLNYYYYDPFSELKTEKKSKTKVMPIDYTKEQKQQIEYAKSIGIKYNPIEPKKSERKFKRNDQSLVEFINDDFSIKKQPRRIEDLSI